MIAGATLSTLGIRRSPHLTFSRQPVLRAPGGAASQSQRALETIKVFIEINYSAGLNAQNPLQWGQNGVEIRNGNGSPEAGGDG